jgi:hypothetical protein
MITKEAERVRDTFFPDIVDTIAMSGTLSQEACEVLRRGAEGIKKRIIDIYTERGLSTQDKERDADTSIREYCWHLHQMRKHNGGKLPDEFERDWRFNSCEGFKFIV